MIKQTFLERRNDLGILLAYCTSSWQLQNYVAGWRRPEDAAALADELCHVLEEESSLKWPEAERLKVRQQLVNAYFMSMQLHGETHSAMEEKDPRARRRQPLPRRRGYSGPRFLDHPLSYT